MPATRINGQALRIIRERSGVTVADLVEAVREEGLDVHPDHLRNIELGHKQPSPKLLTAIARGLKVPVVALLVDPEGASFQPSGGPSTKSRRSSTVAAPADARVNGGRPPTRTTPARTAAPTTREKRSA